jgi:group I intron endonuclease
MNNLINGNLYIGSSINLSKRFSFYFNNNLLNKSNVLINRTILKYGRVNFSLDIIEYCSYENIVKREQYYLDLFKPEYNILKVANSSFGYKHNKKKK